MADEVTLAMTIAAWVAVWHLLIAGYLLAFAERVSKLLLVIGLVKALLGGAIYLVVREPPWAVRYAFFTMDILLPITLALLLVFSFLVTIAIWTAYDLDRPDTRLKAVFFSGEESEIRKNSKK